MNPVLRSFRRTLALTGGLLLLSPALPAAAQGGATPPPPLPAAVAAPASGVPGIDLPPEPGTPAPFTLPAFEEDRLPNGVRVIVVPRHDLPLVSVRVHQRVGSAFDPAGKAGVAELTAALRAKGVRRDGREVDATALAREAEALGSLLETGATRGGVQAGLTVATPRLAAATALVADVVRRPVLAAAELERLRAQTADGLKLAFSDPMALAGMVARRAWWGPGPNGASTTPASLAQVSLADVRAHHQRAAHPMLTTVVFAGDLTLAQGRALAQRHFGDWPATRIALPVAPTSPPQPLDVPMLLVNLPGAGQAGVVVMGPGVAQADPRRRTAQVAAGVLGGGYSARVNVEVRIKRGLSYGAGASLTVAPEGGVLAASAQTQNATAAQVAALLRDELLRLGRDAPGADELAARQATLVGNVTRQAETTVGLAAMALDTVERERPLADLARAVPELRAVTAAQVREFAASAWTPDALRIVVVGDMKTAGEALRALVPGARVIDASALDLAAPSMTR